MIDGLQIVLRCIFEVAGKPPMGDGAVVSAGCEWLMAQHDCSKKEFSRQQTRARFDAMDAVSGIRSMSW